MTFAVDAGIQTYSLFRCAQSIISVFVSVLDVEVVALTALHEPPSTNLEESLEFNLGFEDLKDVAVCNRDAIGVFWCNVSGWW